MGRKRGLPARAREKAAAEEVMQAIEEDQRESLLHSKPDDALFVVDAQGSKRKRMKIEKEARSEKYLSKHEKKMIEERYLGKQTKRKKGKGGAKTPRVTDLWDDDAALAPKAGDGGAVVAISSAGGGGGAGTTGPEAATAGDDEDFAEPPRQPGKPKTAPKPSARDMAKLGVCHPGQSYNPSEDDHDDVLASAVAVELRREEAVVDENTPVDSGMSKETLGILIDDKDFGASDDEAGGGQDDGELPPSIGKKTPATGKLTRTERNKQLRQKLSAKELAEKKRKKDFLKSIESLDDIQMELAREEVARKEKRSLKRRFKARKAKEEAAGAVAGGLFGPGSGIVGMGDKGHASNRDVIAGRSLPVNLKEELHGSMRKLKSQGSLLMDKVELLKASKAHPDARRAKQRAKKASKGFRKKFKYADRYKDD